MGSLGPIVTQFVCHSVFRRGREQLAHRVDAQHGGVLGGGFQSADGSFDHGGSEGGELGMAFAGHPLGERGACGDRSRAAAGQETGFHYPAVFKARGEPQHIAASRIGDIHHDRGRRQFPWITRILKMVQQTLAMHSCFNYR